MNQKLLSFSREFFLIFLGSILYAVSTVIFIFPHSLLLGGTSGISVILESVIPYSPGSILMAINFSLIILAFLVLGNGMALKTLIGSSLTTLFVGIFERVFIFGAPLITNPVLSALLGAGIIAMASGIMFYIDSSSGGTDIIALIVQEFSKIRIGRALLICDVLIVLVGGMLSGPVILTASSLGLIIKTFGIDFVIGQIKKHSKAA